jgi:S-adenosylmethionine:tRNA ribosyltransferase-isomerase
VGEVPLPPYIRRPTGRRARSRALPDRLRARAGGGGRADRGLHLTPELLDALARGGVEVASLTLHVGPGTFLPIRADDARRHGWRPSRTSCRRDGGAIARTRAAAGGSSRSDDDGACARVGAATGRRPGRGEARLFIRPGHRFRVVDALLTNFHLPRSTLLALVAAFAGWDAIRAPTTRRVAAGYRFYSFGDAMLIT